MPNAKAPTILPNALHVLVFYWNCRGIFFFIHLFLKRKICVFLYIWKLLLDSVSSSYCRVRRMSEYIYIDVVDDNMYKARSNINGKSGIESQL